jgi:hypothetical protein
VPDQAGDLLDADALPDLALTSQAGKGDRAA